MKNILIQFKESAERIQADLDTPVLDGNPYVLATKNTDGAGEFDLIFGDLYPDQLKDGGPKQAFRLQRRFDLCGCPCYSPESADRLVAKANAASPAPQSSIYKIHRRDWLKLQLSGLQKSIALLEAAIAKLEASESPK